MNGSPRRPELRQAQLLDAALNDIHEDFTRIDEIGVGLKAFDQLRGKLHNVNWTTARWPTEGLLSVNGRTCISGRDLRARLIRSRHDKTVAGHPGIEMTQDDQS